MINWAYISGDISGFSILFHHSITLSVSLKLGKVFPPTQFLFSKIALAVLFLLVFQIKLRRILSISTRNLAGILRGIIEYSFEKEYKYNTQIKQYTGKSKYGVGVKINNKEFLKVSEIKMYK